MNTKDFYSWLMSMAIGGVCDGFDAHVIASVVSIAVFDGKGDGPALVEGLGLEADEIVALIGQIFPPAKPVFDQILSAEIELSRPTDEEYLREYLGRYASCGKLSLILAAIIARRALQPHHLWQDLGLRNRRELSWLMERHFAGLAARNVHDMKWKKYLYRAICRDEGFTLCVAPSCNDCSDFDHCFGDENGEDLVGHAPIESPKYTIAGRIPHRGARPAI